MTSVNLNTGEVREHCTPYVGHFYLHPQDGPIYVTSGYYMDPSNGRVSNHFYWTVVETGEVHNGYAGLSGPWVNIDDQWEVTFKRRKK